MTSKKIPNTAVPDIAVPDTAVPDTAVPEIIISDTAVPDTVVRDTLVADTAVPHRMVPDTAVPDTMVPDIAVHHPMTNNKDNVHKRKHRSLTDECRGNKLARINVNGTDAETAAGADDDISPPAVEAETMTTAQKLHLTTVAVAVVPDKESVAESVALEVKDKSVLNVVAVETDNKMTATTVSGLETGDGSVAGDMNHVDVEPGDGSMAGDMNRVDQCIDDTEQSHVDNKLVVHGEDLALVTTETENQSVVAMETVGQSLVTAEMKNESLVAMETMNESLVVSVTEQQLKPMMVDEAGATVSHSVNCSEEPSLLTAQLKTLSPLTAHVNNMINGVNNVIYGEKTEQRTTVSSESTLSTSTVSPSNNQSTLHHLVPSVPILRPALAEIQLTTETTAAGTQLTPGSTTAHSPDQMDSCKSSHPSTGAPVAPSPCEGAINIAGARNASNVISATTTTTTTGSAGAINTDSTSCTGGINAQLLSLPRSIVDCRNLSRPLTLRFHGRQVIVPPSCVILTADGAKLLLPPHTLSAPAVHTVNHTVTHEPLDYSRHTQSNLPAGNTCTGSSTTGKLDTPPAQVCLGVGAVDVVAHSDKTVFDKTDVSRVDELIDSKIEVGLVGVKREVNCADPRIEINVTTAQHRGGLCVADKSVIDSIEFDCHKDECEDLSAGTSESLSRAGCEVTGVMAECAATDIAGPKNSMVGSVETDGHQDNSAEAASDIATCSEDVDMEQENVTGQQDATKSTVSTVSAQPTVSTQSTMSTMSAQSTKSTVSTQSTISTKSTVSAQSTVLTISTKSTVSTGRTADSRTDKPAADVANSVECQNDEGTYVPCAAAAAAAENVNSETVATEADNIASDCNLVLTRTAGHTGTDVGQT